MAESRCERTDLIVEQCAHCKADGSPPERTRVAEYRGTCTSCGKKIEPGTRIGLVQGNWICCYRRTKTS